MLVDLQGRIADLERDFVRGRDGPRLHVVGGVGEPRRRKLGGGVSARLDRLGRSADQYGGTFDRGTRARPYLMSHAVDRGRRELRGGMSTGFDLAGRSFGAADQQFLEPPDLAF